MKLLKKLKSDNIVFHSLGFVDKDEEVLKQAENDRLLKLRLEAQDKKHAEYVESLKRPIEKKENRTGRTLRLIDVLKGPNHANSHGMQSATN